MTREHLFGLNKSQRAAATYGISQKAKRLPRPQLVLAGPGSGKTRVIVARAAHLVVNGVDPNRILLLTFTNKAATEVKERSAAAMRKAGCGNINLKWAGTFHSVAYRLLRKYGRGIGVDLGFTFLDQDDAKAFMRRCCDELFKGEKKPGNAIIERAISVSSRMANCGLSLSKAANVPIESLEAKQLERLITAFRDEKKRQNVLDFDDLLLAWQKLLVGKTTRKAVRRLFDHVLVDEYQDTNWVQADILQKLKPDGRGLIVVGDDAQSIYSFRGARIGNILEFPERFVAQPKIFKLQRNYRSAQPILDACNAVLAKAEEGYRRTLRSKVNGKRLPRLVSVPDSFVQAQYIVKATMKSRTKGIPLREQAVLFRSSADSVELELELQRLRIPFIKYGGQALSQAAYVKDICSILKWCHNPHDRTAALRALQLVAGIGEAKATRIFGSMSGLCFAQVTKGIVPRTKLAEWRKFRRMIARARKRSWPRAMRVILRWYGPHFEAREKNLELAAAKLKRIESIADSFDSRESFLAAITLEEPGTKDAPNELAEDGRLALSTIHSAKGREWRAVRILSAISGCIPDSRAQSVSQIEEERRLLYVAMSRAKSVLDIVVPKRMRHLGSIRTRLKRTQFIDESDLALYKNIEYAK